MAYLPAMKWKLALSFVGLLVIVASGWALQWRYDQVQVGPYDTRVVRTNRFTGEVEYLSPRGWYSRSKVMAPLYGPSPCPANRVPTPYDDVLMECDPRIRTQADTATR